MFYLDWVWCIFVIRFSSMFEIRESPCAHSVQYMK